MKRFLALILMVALGRASVSAADLRAGAAAVDITPTNLPVLVNGGFLSRSVDKVRSPLHARALVLDDGRTRVALVVVDTCIMGRPLIDEAKALAAKATGIPADHILVSATHTHTAPSVFACLGTEADEAYVPYLRARIADAVAAAQAALEPAEAGFARTDAGAFTAVRRWIRRSDRVADDPFSNRTVRANMHAAKNWDDVTGPSGPEDPELSMISIRARDGRPLAVLANFSMHYFGDQDLSADYFGLFCEGLRRRLAPEAAPGKAPFVGILSHGCSGDIWRCDYLKPEAERDPWKDIAKYADGLLDLAVAALKDVRYRGDADLAMAERRMMLNYRVPDRQRLEWAQRVAAPLTNRLPKTQSEVYAREQMILHEWQRTEIVLQALRIGDVAVAATPCETYAITGLKIKTASPLPQCMVIELANGGDGYIPPPEQHLLGGYNTWPARSAGLEVGAEPRIAEALIALLETVCAKPRRAAAVSDGPAVRAVLRAEPAAYWRLDESAGPHAADATGRGRDAAYEPAVAYFLDGPAAPDFCGAGAVNRAPHFAGGRLRARLDGIGDRYSVSLWLWNGMPNEGRGVAGWLVSRGPDQGLGARGDHLGVGGTNGAPGRLVFLHGDNAPAAVAGTTVIPRWTWHHVALVRDGAAVRVYLDGKPEIDTKAAGASGPGGFFFGGRSDGDSGWEGRLDEIAVFDRALSSREIRSLASP
ncbi:MAG: hypothetical protein FJ221_10720 [Lentisphaerae bacterium]|nr:hypothetical protein [Lentisphaerota bacterium]